LSRKDRVGESGKLAKRVAGEMQDAS